MEDRWAKTATENVTDAVERVCLHKASLVHVKKSTVVARPKGTADWITDHVNAAGVTNLREGASSGRGWSMNERL